MNTPTRQTTHLVAKAALYGSAALVALVPFHAFLSVWAASHVGHYTAVRLWKEYLLLVLLLMVVGGLPKLVLRSWRKLRAARSGSDGHLWWRRADEASAALVLAVVAYLIVLLVSAGWALLLGQESHRAVAYGLLLDCRFLIFFGVIWLAVRGAGPDSWAARHWRQLLLWPASLVVVVAILQFTVLPADFLTHFGYGPDTISAVETIDQKASYQRVQSTLRGANPLGAYLVVVVAALAVLALRTRRRRLWYGAALAVTSLALAMTYSRSAWLGAAAALGWLVWTSLRSARARRWLLVAGAAAVVVLAGTTYLLRDNDLVQNTLFHTDEHSQSAISSNFGHVSAARQGAEDILNEPFGEGVGSAGPASVYSGQPPRIAENYFIQIGQETGVIGLTLFIGVNVAVGRLLWLRRDRTLASALLAALVGLSIVNLLSHAWTDDTLSYLWWGLAALAAAPAGRTAYTKNNHEHSKVHPPH